MRIGFYFSVTSGSGGEYQYSRVLLEELVKIPGHHYLVLLSQGQRLGLRRKNTKTIQLKTDTSPTNKFFSILYFLISRFLLGTWRKKSNQPLYQLLKSLHRLQYSDQLDQIDQLNLDLIIFPTSEVISAFLKTKTVVAVHDLQHRLQPNFREVSANGLGKYRDFVYDQITQKAVVVLSDSKTGGADIKRCFPKTKAKILALSYISPILLPKPLSHLEKKKILSKLNLPEKYFFYPARFWPHKNHQLLIKALAILNKEGIEVSTLLSGNRDTSFSSYPEVVKLVKKYNLENSVRYMGYLSDRELAMVYQQSLALVMPTFFGPTNIPILEAWQNKTAVVASRVRGSGEQIGRAGMLFDPKSPRELAGVMKKVATEPGLRQKMISLGRQKLKTWTRKDFRRMLGMIISQSARMTSNARNSYS